MARRRGMGSLFQRIGCKTWTLQYYVDGRRKREPSHTTDYAAAQRLLTRRLYQVAVGEAVEPERKPVRVEELWSALRTDCLNNGRRRAVRDLGTRWLHLRPVFAELQARRVTTETVATYIRQRQEEGAANATINRETGALKRAFNLGRRSTPPRVQLVPYMPMLKENNTRRGFVEDADYARLVQGATELWLRTYLELAYTYGWRQAELLALRCRQVNLVTRTIRLDPGTTKNREGREVTMTATVHDLLSACIVGKSPDAYVLTRTGNRPVRDMRRAWQLLCVQAALGTFVCQACGAEGPTYAAPCSECKARRWKYRGLIPHDLRRSAAKALRRAGVPESVIMAMGGWKTASMFRRYAIVSTVDQQQAVRALELQRSAPPAVPSEQAKAPISAPIVAPEPKAVTRKVQ